MLVYPKTQINTTNQNFSSLPHKTEKTLEFNVSYRTQEYLDELTTLHWKYLQNKRSKLIKAPFAIIKRMGGLLNKYGNCEVSQHKFGKELSKFGCNKNKNIQERQVRRHLSKLREAGIVTYSRKNPDQDHSINTYQLTQLGMDLYHYCVQNNNWMTKLKVLELSPKPVDNFFDDQKKTGAFAKNDRWGGVKKPNDSVVFGHKNAKNDRYISNIYKNINNNIIRVERANKPSHIFSFNPYSEMKPEEKLMTAPTMNRHLTAEQLDTIEQVLENVDVRPGDEAILHDEIAQTLTEYRKRGIQVTDFKFFANAVREQTWKKYYWDMRPNAGMRH